mgnify:CR=1 FL=1
MPKYMTTPAALGGVRITDVEFQVEFADRKGETFYFKDWDEACGQAVSMAASGSPVHLDVLIYSEAAARKWGGDDTVRAYKEDPDAVSVRIEVRADHIGPVR